MDQQTLKTDPLAEREVIGGVILSDEQGRAEEIAEVFSILEADDFFDDTNRDTFAAMRTVHSEGKPLEAHFVKAAAVDGRSVVLAMYNARIEVLTSAYVLHYARLVKEAARHRQLFIAAKNAANALEHCDDSGQIMATLRSELDAVRDASTKPEVDAVGLVPKVLADIQYDRAGLIATGLPGLDDAIGGGLAAGEMVVVAARPSHGKTAMALQCAHHWTAAGMPVLYDTEEMSEEALVRRTIMYASDIPVDRWRADIKTVASDIGDFYSGRERMHIVSGLRTSDKVALEIERHVSKYKIRAAIVDYAQLLQSPGKTRYEQITYTSARLAAVAKEQNIVILALCQLGRDIESRTGFQPRMSDIKESGQFEQDADVIIFLVWPHRVDRKNTPNEYKFYIAKNRNRPIIEPVVICRFEPGRQRAIPREASDFDNYEPAFE